MAEAAFTASPTRVGWCPGALRPMWSGDGLLVRVKPRGGVLDLAQAEGLAALATEHGNGQLDLTGRANLQVRGVTEQSLAPLLQGLGRLRLLDADPDAEAVRNVVASPLAGLDPSAAADIRPVLAALERRLAADPNCRRLPAKWSIVVDDGGAFALDDVAADLRFRFVAESTCFVGLCGAWAMADAGQVDAVLAGLAAFAASRQPSRMNDLVNEAGAEALFAAAGLEPTDRRPQPRPRVSAGNLLGGHGLFVGVAPPFGSLPARGLAGLVALARRAGAHDLRLTPWRVLLVRLHSSPLPCEEGQGVRVARPVSSALNLDCSAEKPSPLMPLRKGEGNEADVLNGVHLLPRESDGSDQSASVLAAAAAAGLIVDGADPRLSLAACTGAPGCHRATVPTRADAARLASTLPRGTGIVVHVSGCEKGCARPGSTPWTLVGRGGRYDLVRDGTARDTPVARGLSFAEAAAWVRGAMQGASV